MYPFYITQRVGEKRKRSIFLLRAQFKSSDKLLTYNFDLCFYIFQKKQMIPVREKKFFLSCSLIIALITLFEIFNFYMFIATASVNWLLNWQLLIKIVFPVLEIVAVVIFITSQFKRSEFLKILVCYHLFILPLQIAGIKFSFDHAARFNSNLFDNKLFVINLILTTILMITYVILLWRLSKYQTPRLTYITIGNENIAEFTAVKKGVRFANRLVDLTIIFLVLYINIIDNRQFRELFSGTGSGTLIIIEVSLGFYYYLLLEGFFNTTIGKIITGTTIVDIEGKRPGFSRIIARTLCRFIPFEAFSFLGIAGRGWHDSISETYVVKAENNLINNVKEL